MYVLWSHVTVLLDAQHPMGVRSTPRRNLIIKSNFRVKGETIQVIVFIIYVLSVTVIYICHLYLRYIIHRINFFLYMYFCDIICIMFLC